MRTKRLCLDRDCLFPDRIRSRNRPTVLYLRSFELMRRHRLLPTMWWPLPLAKTPTSGNIRGGAGMAVRCRFNLKAVYCCMS